MRKFLFFILILILIGFSVSFFIGVFKPQIIPNKTVNIKKGISIAKIGSLLEEEEIIHSTSMFVALVKLLNREHKLHYGKFNFSGKYSLIGVIRVLSNAEIVKNQITIPEGFTVRKIAYLLAQNNLADYSKFVKLTTDTTFISSLNIKVESLEGFLFPDTYYIPYFADEKYIIKMMVNNFFLQLETVQSEKISFVPFRDNSLTGFDSLYSTLILASIIEKEAIYDDERAIIAGVYENRLANRMLLQADPTVAYALELSGKSRKKIYYEDLKINSVYNTYKHIGLPPTPICNPGLESITAALNPAKTDYFFFFAGKKSRHIFSTTYREHLKKLNRI